MIWRKDTCSHPDEFRYFQCFEYMFVFSKGRPKTINLIRDRLNLWQGTVAHGTDRRPDGSIVRKSHEKKRTVAEYGARFNVWDIPCEKNNTTGHPAPFPLSLARDHIRTWSSEGDIVLDPFLGSGTTALAAIDTNRHFIGFDISADYVKIARDRIDEALAQIKLF